MFTIEDDRAQQSSHAHRDLAAALARGARFRCPACGEGRLYSRYLKVVDTCAVCGEELHHQRADDAPPYFTMAIVGHVVVGGILALEMAYRMPVWMQLIIWLPILLVLSLGLLPVIKGMLVGLQWALRMHGFGGDEHGPIKEPGQP